MKKKYISKTAPFIRDWQLYCDNFITKTQKLNIKFKLIFAITTLICLCFNEINAQSPSTFTTSGTWVCPRGVTQIQVEAYGGGAGGQICGSANNSNAGGGGGGAYAARNNVAVVPGNTYTITIGAAGAAGAPGAASDAIFGLVTVRAAGGATGTSLFSAAGTGGIGGLLASSQGDIGLVFAGGNGGNGTFQPSGNNSGNGGGGGGGASSTGAGNPGFGITAGGVKLNFGGAGGAGGLSSNGTAAPTVAGNYGGGGGGGGNKNNSGGAGQPGAIIITFTCPTENAAAGLDQVVCSTTATMAGNTPTSAGLTGTWTLIAGTATITTPNSPTTGITGLGASATLRWTINNGRCGSTFDEVLITRETVPLVTLTPNPSNAATGVCYAGTGVVTSISWVATAGATSYDVYFGTAISPVTLSANVITNSYTIGALSASTTYYWRIVAKNACGNAPSSAIWSFTTATTPCAVYCTPTASSGVDGTGITNVSYSTVNNTTNNTLVYNNYTAFVGNVIQGAAMPISVTTATGNKRYNVKIWVDWNDDGDFIDAGEEMFSGNVLSNTINGIINVPLTAIVGNHRMRVGITQGQGNGASFEITTPCFTGVNGAFEDYTLNVTPAVVCTLAPTLTTSPANTTMASNGTATLTAAFANGPTNFVWEVSTDGGTNFTTITNTGIYSGANTTALTITNPTGVLNGFIYRVTASNACGTSPVSGSALLTVTIVYCIPASNNNTHWIATVFSDGNLNDTSYSGTPAYSITPVNGYANYSSTVIATQTPGGGVNISYILGSSAATGGQLNLQRVSCFVDWNGDSDFVDANEIVYTTANVGVVESSFGFVVPLSQNPGIYRMRIRTRQTIPPPAIDGCTVYTNGETEDYSIAIVPDCAARIQSVTNNSVCGANNTMVLGALGLGGTTTYRWYNAENGGLLVGTSSSSSWTTPALAATTTFYVTAFNGSCESLTRTPVKATVNPTTNISFSPTSPSVCGENNVISIQALGDIVEVDLLNERFENGLGNFSLTTVTNNSNTGPRVNAPWSVRTNTYQPTDTSVWKPAINSGNISENFVITTSDYSLQTLDTRLTTTNNINTVDFINLTLTFKHYYSDYGAGDTAAVEVSTDGGASWLPANIVATYNSDFGAASRFTGVSINLSAYITLTSLKFRFKYVAGWNDGWAIDDIRLFGTKQLNTTFSWNDPGVSAFTDLACTVPYVAQTVTTIYVKPTATQLEVPQWTFTAIATLGNGCPISKLITVTNTSKIWQGGTNWETAANWKPVGVPTAINCVIIPSVSVIPGGNYLAYAKNLTVKPTGNLNIISGSSLTVTDFVNVNTAGIFNIENNGSLVQINNIANIGPISYRRTATGIKGSDYIYWSSPVNNQILSAIYTTPTPGPKYQWNTLVNNNNGAFGNISQGNWNIDSDISMIKAKGYTMRGSSTFSSPAVNILSTFSGVPNNGDIPIDIYRGAYTGVNYIGANGATITNLSDNYNLLGNPYPSAINALQFLSDNSTVIKGNVSLWTHGTDPMTGLTNPFYGTFGYNYSPSDYTTINFTGSTIPGSTDIIKSGQAFFVEMIDGLAATATVNFKNNLRRNSSNNPYSNSNFFRTNNSVNTVDFNAIERSRIWLDIVDADSLSERTLIGYVNGATLSSDHFYDAATTPNGNIDIYTLIGDENFVIQGRPLPFDSNDIVPIGFKVATAGIFKIAINTLDGLFITTNQTIYLEDTDLGIIHDLRTAPYTFTTSAGTFSSRFKLRYTNNSLGYEETIKNQTFAFISNNMFQVQSGENIKQIMLYDVAGKLIKIYQPNELSNHFKANFFFANGVYFVKITLENGIEVAKKLLH